MSGEHSEGAVQFCTPLFCTENNEDFLIGKYNGVEILYRASDKFINVSRLCINGGRCFKTFKRGDRWRKIIEYWSKQYNKSGERFCSAVPIYELKGKYDRSRGQYVHPKLIDFVADWISIEYSFKVAEIMDLINERNQVEMILLMK